MKKYELTDEVKEVLGHKLHRIRALKDFGIVHKGELGGEVFALFLLGFYWMVLRVIRDTLGARGGKGTWR